MVGIYLSGTGNTKHCTEKLLSILDKNAEAIPIEDENAPKTIEKENTIILAYPTQFSNSPLMVRDFIVKHSSLWKDKRVLCMTTMGAFSGDGAGCTARLLKKHGAVILGGLQIHMPDSVCDSKLLKKTLEENRKIVIAADEKTEKAAQGILNGKYPKEGITFFSHIIGLLGQRLWFYGRTRSYSDKLKINENCIGCGLCSRNCPMKNIEIINGKAVPKNKCTMCYRCISRCPRKAVTLLGNSVQEQCRIEKYI